MKKVEDKKQYYFVDEAGDPTFYNKIGKNIVGTEGCSPILLLGFVKTKKPQLLREAIQALHTDVVNDPYFAGIPSMEKTRVAFHAKDDVPEIREKVFKCINKLDFSYHCIVARKTEKIFESKYRKKENFFYFDLMSKLFENSLHKSKINNIYYATRGNKTRQTYVEEAIENARNAFAKKWGSTEETKTIIYPQTPSGELILQVVDYINWAVQRAFVKKEMRYFNFISGKVSYLVDIFDFPKYPKNFYTKANIFDINKISPIELGPNGRTA